MHDFSHRDRFYVDGTYKRYFIECSALEEGEEPFTLTNEDLIEESLTITEAVMTSDTFTYANCISNSISFTTTKQKTFKRRMLRLYEILENYDLEPIPIGTYYVDQDTISRDGKTREITAYDSMFFLINLRVTDWYNSLSFPITVKDLRDSLCLLFELEQDESELINDDIYLPKQISESDEIYGSDIIKSLCEMNAVFARLSKDNILEWVSIDTEDVYAKALYPGEDIFPGAKTEEEPGTFPGKMDYSGFIFEIEKSYYVEDSVYWESYPVLPTDGIEIRGAGNSIAYQTDPYAINPYIISDNLLMTDLSSGQYAEIGERLFERMRELTYIPYEATTMTDPCLETGDRIKIHTQEDTTLFTYVFSKKTSGMQVPFDTISANGSLLFNDYKNTKEKTNNLDKRVGNVEKTGTRPLQILSVATLPDNPELNVLYLIQGEVVVQ